MLTLGGIAVAVMIVILLLFFNVRWRLLPLAVVLVGIIWAFGATGFLGIPLTLVTIAGLPVMLGIGIDYAIQMHSRIEEEVIIDASPHPIQAAARGLGPALLVVTFDAVFAFLAIQLSQVPMVRQFGWLLTVGIIAICISSIINPLAILGIREYRSPTQGKDFSEGRLGRFVVWLGKLPPSTAIAIAVVSVAIFVVGSWLEPSLKLESDPINWVNQDSPEVKGIRELHDEYGRASEMGLYVVATDGRSLFEQPTVDFIDTFSPELIERNPDVLRTVEQHRGHGGRPDRHPRRRPCHAQGRAREGGLGRRAQRRPDLERLARRHRAERRVPDQAVSLEDLAVAVEHVRDNADPPPETRATPSGLAVVGVGLLENLEANLVQLTWLAVGLVFLFLAVRLRSFVRAILSVVPVLIATGAATIIIYLFNIELSPMTAVGGPLVVATCTEFTSLMLLRYIEERRRGLEPRAAIDVTAARTGRAFIVSAMTAISGVAVIAFSSMPLLRNFGLFVALKVAIALFAALVFLPPLIVWADKRGWVSKGMLDHEDEPFIDVPRNREEVGPGRLRARDPTTQPDPRRSSSSAGVVAGASQVKFRHT